MAQLDAHPQAFYRGLRMVAMDGSKFELPDEAENVERFGRPGSRTGVAGYPQAQCGVLVECLTHAILAANLGAYRDPEWEDCEPLLGALKPDMLCMADRGFSGFEQWRQAQATGAHLLWRASDNRLLPVVQMLDDGSYLSTLQPTGVGREQMREQALSVRVVEYTLPGVPEADSPDNARAKSGRFRLITTLLDAQAAPAAELAALYHQRWHIESVFDELKTHLRQGRRVLRSKTPELVHQEFYGWVLAHYAVRWLLHQGATYSRTPHEELSFTGHVQLLRRAQPRSGAFPPRAAEMSSPLVQ